MTDDTEELARYLREFQPLGVRQLEVPRSEAKAQLWLSIAATVLLCGAFGLWYAGPSKKTAIPAVQQSVSAGTGVPVVRKNAFSLTKLALEDDHQFQAQLAAESRMVLPSCQDAHGALHVLAKE